MKNRIDQKFADLRDAGQRAFVTYICAGDPDIDTTVEIVLALEKAGADIAELGIPFSDPLADGVVNQMAAQRALEAGTTTAKVLELVRKIRQRSEIPLVLFTYLNPVYTYGVDAFFSDAAAAGVDGILPLDLPPDEARQNAEIAGATGLKQIRLIAPTTPPARIAEIAAASEGFIYYVSREGVTGEQDSIAAGIREQVGRIRSASPVPVVVGFGISNPGQASTVAEMADGVVVGSAIVKMIAEHGRSPDLVTKIDAFVSPIASAIKSVGSR